MTTLEMGDSATPPPTPARLPVYAFYIYGQADHIWSPDEMRTIRARYTLPIAVNLNPSADPAAYAAGLVDQLHGYGISRGATVALDREDVDMPTFVAELNARLHAAGYPLMDYQSKGAMAGQPVTDGGLWVPDWTGIPHMYEGARATQYADAPMTGLPWDSSVIDAAVPLHELNPPARHHIAELQLTVHLPELARGDSGPAVTRLQHLILAWNEHELAKSGTDGVFGPETTAAVRSFQRVYGITEDAGTVTAETWDRLLEG